jgi:hypothetical protein
MNEKNKAKLAELRKAHGDIASVEVQGELYAFRTPSQDEFEAYQSRRQKGVDDPGVCYRDLAQKCCVTDQGALQELFKRKPAINVNFANRLAEMAGADIELTVGND